MKTKVSMNPSTTQINKLLLDAADILEEKGWCRGQYENALGQHCAVGALWAALPDDQTPQSLVVDAAIFKIKTITKEGITVWNDRLAINGEEVITVFRAAAQ